MLIFKIFFVSDRNVKILHWKKRKINSENKEWSLNTPAKVVAFRKKMTNTLPPPKPILNCWDTWLEAVRIFETIEETVNGLLAADAQWIRAVQTVPGQKATKLDLTYIHTTHAI